MKKNKSQVFYSDAFEEQVFEKAIQMEAEGLLRGHLDTPPFKNWEIFFNDKPKYCVYSVKIKDDAPVLAGKTIYVGSNE